MLKSCGLTIVTVNLGPVNYTGAFHVLPGSIPLILGMSFLGEMAPNVDWS
jgi:hypothetical protein